MLWSGCGFLFVNCLRMRQRFAPTNGHPYLFCSPLTKAGSTLRSTSPSWVVSSRLATTYP